MAELIVSIVLATFNLVFGIFILMGKCDGFIQGCFNFPTSKDAEKFDIIRLRILLGIFLLILAPLFLSLNMEGSKWPGHYFSATIFSLLIIYYILVYTWAKKR